MTPLSITVTDHQTCSVITLAGELDRLSADRLRQVIDRSVGRGRTRLIVDVAELTFCDSVGMWVLLEGHHHAVAVGGWLRLAFVHGTLKRILRIIGTIRAHPSPSDLVVIMER
ncbi:STAS domain-containing protein [Streptosporangium sp. NPDC023615]|uniref:STAS domain-containing protein n=1 Tax=Streptosporangium sp. NPDC023615 TaxID=3154794 RepID=UPI0034495570